VGRHRHLRTVDGEDEVAVGRVEHHVDLHRRAGDHRSRRPRACGEPAVRPDRHQREPGRDVAADRGPHRAGPVGGRAERVEGRAEAGEARPPEHVRERLLAPADALLGAQPPVARDHLDH
jgi:hypothetical protein